MKKTGKYIFKKKKRERKLFYSNENGTCGHNTADKHPIRTNGKSVYENPIRNNNTGIS